MGWRLASLLVIAAVAACAEPQPPTMTPLGATPRPDDLPARIGYPARPKGPVDGVVLLDWDRMVEVWPAAGPVARDRTIAQAALGMGIRFFTLPVGATTYDVDVYALASAEAAQRQLLSLASMTMMPINPFVKGPPLGDLSCRLPPSGERDRVMWTCANVLVDLRSEHGDPATMDSMAADLDARLRASVVDAARASQSAPAILDVEAAPTVGRVGQPVVVHWRTQATSAVTSAAIVVDEEASGATVVDATDTALTFTAERPGEVGVAIVAVCPRWLVPRQATLRVVVSN